MGAQDEKLPDAIGKRQKVISLSEGGTFIVTRWTLTKTIMMASWMAGAMKDVTGLDLKKLDEDFMDSAKRLVQVLGDKVPEFLSLAVEPIDKAAVLDMPADDALDVLQAIIELNITDKFLGKVKGLTGLFKSRFMANSKST